ncbi:MAG TPA: hypothetical protein P5290_03610 [Candidatus Methanomethylicus sp.]|nr:hypothetical protein [Candidatus Methanomethylicus sp.]
MAADECEVCGGTAGGRLCALHLEAKRRLERHFGVWRERMGVGWQDYLKMVQGNPAAGSAVKEVATHLLGDQETDKGSPGERSCDAKMGCGGDGGRRRRR